MKEQIRVIGLLAVLALALILGIKWSKLQKDRDARAINLASAVASQDVETVRRLLEEGADPNAPFSVDRTSEVAPYTPWMYAFTRGLASPRNRLIVLLMINHGADLSAHDQDGRACQQFLRGDAEVARAMQERHGD